MLKELLVSMAIIAQKQAMQITEDSEALEVKYLYPEWKPNKDYEVDFRVRVGDDLYKCRQAHTSTSENQPSTDTASIWTKIDEVHNGTLEDPIPYNGNMELFEGKYYVQDKIIYKCIRDSEIAIFGNLNELIEVYVEVSDE